MKLSFSTRGWENYSFEENVQTALTMSFDGVELYNPQNPDEYNSRYSNDYGDVMDVESSETGFSSEDDSDDDAIDVDFTVRD